MSIFSSSAASRRTLVRFAALAAVATATIAGCSNAAGELRSGGATSGSETPVDGGTLKVGVLQDLTAGGLMTGTTSTQILNSGLVYDRLVEYSAGTLEPQPSVATGWAVAEDGLTYTLTLRDDVKYHSGRTLTSADAEFSLRAYTDPVWNAQLRSTAAAITGYNSSDPTTLVLTLDQPIGNLFDLLSMVPLIDSETVDQLRAGEAYIGTGPFVLDSRTPNSTIVYKANDAYWAEGQPHLDGIEAQIIPDTNSLLANLRAGQIDVSGELTSRDVNTVGGLGGFEVLENDAAAANSYIGINVTAPGLSDARVRQAIAYAVDRDRIVDEVYRGAAYPAVLPWPRRSPAYDEAANQAYARDLDTARKLIAEVGEIPSIPLSYPTGNPTYELAAQIVQANLAEVGITVDLVPVEYSVAISKLIAGEFPGMWLLTHGFAQYTPSTLTVSAFPFNASRNASNYESASYRAAAEAAWHVADGASPEALERYKTLNSELLDGLFVIELASIVPRTVTSARVHGYAQNRRGEPLLAGTYLS
ncbi:ABC transporter substrate-binding protein [Tomitella biformata]|uniref:ABC transporter substrate-binding protein n=1 Tax=Tomitella biformata TaxID=630403 RepID=UPI000466D9DB|nr:ABC transporter substrate-binding protein [Tomitella biformata]